MKPTMQKDSGFERRPGPSLWDTLIRVALIGALAVLCFQVFSPFLNLMVWSMILAVALYPLHQSLARRIGGRQRLTSTILVIIGVLLVVVPTWLLMNSFADSVQSFLAAVKENTPQIPPPAESVKNWPIVGNNVYEVWSNAHSDLPGLVHSMQPKLGDLTRDALSTIAKIGSTMLLFLATIVVANIIMAYGGSAARSGRAIFSRLAGSARGEVLTKLALATIRTVALGVVGVAAIQALLKLRMVLGCAEYIPACISSQPR